MTIDIDLPPHMEERLQEEASREGQEAGEYVRTLVERHLTLTALEALKHRKPPQSLADLKPRIPRPPGKSWLEGVVGQWPGDESDEEIYKALEEMS
jgi:hypothetical protein